MITAIYDVDWECSYVAICIQEYNAADGITFEVESIDEDENDVDDENEIDAPQITTEKQWCC